MNKQELIERIKRLDESYLKTEFVLKLIEQLDEPGKVKIPSVVARWIGYAKGWNKGLHYALSNASDEVLEWLCVDKLKRQEIFARAWIFGYKVEKEKRYEVILCNGQSLKTVYRQGSDHLDFEMVYGNLESFTRKQLQEANFGWVFSCEGIEMEEVE